MDVLDSPSVIRRNEVSTWCLSGKLYTALTLVLYFIFEITDTVYSLRSHIEYLPCSLTSAFHWQHIGKVVTCEMHL